MAQVRHAEVTWAGDLISGSGTIDYVSSGAFSRLPLTWASRTEAHGGRTSPEELLAAAHASCFSMALSSDLAKAGTPPQRLRVTARVSADRVDGRWTVTSSELTVRGRVPGLSPDSFRQAAEGAKDGCPISRALKGNVELRVDAELESA
ncbi:MAG TPA: OsmC family peroxiredoxin [Candidatus Dormibacteraeota bacterium]|nr:OsmC family peroxiredoxin [Candidatus Dormibacteraeota bacterium]